MSTEGYQHHSREPNITAAQLEEGLPHLDNVPNTPSGGSPSGRQSGSSSAAHSRPHSVRSSPQTSRRQSDSRPLKEKHRVRFGIRLEDSVSQDASGSSTQSRDQSRSGSHSRNGSGAPSEANADDSAFVKGETKASESKPPPIHLLQSGPSSSYLDGSMDISESSLRSPASTLGTNFQLGKDDEGEDSSDDNDSQSYHNNVAGDPGVDVSDVAAFQADMARHRAERLSRSLGTQRLSKSAPGSKLPSPGSSGAGSPTLGGHTPELPRDMTNLIPMEKFQQRRKKYGIEDETDSEDEKDEDQPKMYGYARIRQAAKRIMKSWGRRGDESSIKSIEPDSAQLTPMYDRDDPSHASAPEPYRSGILGALLKFENRDSSSTYSGSRPLSWFRDSQTATANATPMTTPGGSPAVSPPSSGHATPRRKPPKWHEKTKPVGESSTTSLHGLISTSSMLASPSMSIATPLPRPVLRSQKRSSGAFETLKSLGRKEKRDKDIRIRNHIEDVLARQQFIINCCRALMKYGAPTHRLEEYLRFLGRVLQMKCQFLYIPGCMLISFDDPSTHTTEMRIIREAQGVDLGKLRDLHDIYKAVTHDKVGVNDASDMLLDLWNKKPLYHPWVCVFLYGCASATVGPFAFDARPIDMPIAFLLGSLLGWMQLILAPRSELYSNVFEITAAVVTSFLARAFGSIRGGDLFCFSALAQSSIALILPGYMVLGAALELQSRNMVAGSVRMVYAIIYSLFLGFGITIGTAFYGGIDSAATSDTTCRSQPIGGYWKFIFVPFFTLCLVLINQAKWKQAPIMVVISFAGYVVNYFSALRFSSNAQIANTLGALAIGIVGNLYSRLGHGVSAAALLPAIFVQVPSGLAATGSLVSGISTADQIVSNSTTSMVLGSPVDGGIVFNVGYSMIQVAVGLTVGLFFSSLLIYPLGKKRSGLFSF